MSNNISGGKIISSFVWVAIEKFGYSVIRFISTLVLARLLTPHAFGLVGSVIIITDISNMIVESGLGAALVNKKQVDRNDFDTVFTFNILISILLFAIIYFLAPFFSVYLGDMELQNIIRLLSLTLIFNAITLVQRTILIRNLWFKKQSFINILALILSVMVAIAMAMSGLGVWALVAQLVSYSAIYSIIIVFVIHYIPKLTFSWFAFKELLNFGGRITLSSALRTIYNSIIASVIAKVYSFKITGLYTQSQKIISFPSNIFQSLFDSAAFPVLSKVRGTNEFEMRSSQINRGIYLIAFPLLMIIPFSSDNVIMVVLGAQWLDATKMLVILSVGVVFLIINTASFNVLKSAGEAKVYLRIGFYRTLIGFVILGFTVFLSLEMLLVGIIITNSLASFLCIKQIDRLTSYKMRKQINDILKPAFIAVIANGFAYFLLGLLNIPTGIWSLLLFILLMGSVFITTIYIFKVRDFQYLIQVIKKRLK